MTRFVVGDDRSQSTLFPERLDDYLGEDNPVRAIDVLVDELDLANLGFDGVEPEATGRPAYHPATLRQEIQRLNGLNTQMMQTEDKQISLTDPDARSMATSGRGSGMVGYNVQSAVDTKHHLIVRKINCDTGLLAGYNFLAAIVTAIGYSLDGLGTNRCACLLRHA